MDIGCSCVYLGEGEEADIFREKTVKGRKEYKCIECGDTIKKGESHECAEWLYEGEWGSARTCLVCVNIRKSVFCYEYTIGSLKQTILEEFGIDYTKHVE
jgi:hypothetical protein